MVRFLSFVLPALMLSTSIPPAIAEPATLPYSSWINVPITYRIRVLWILDVGSLTFSLTPVPSNPNRFTVVSEARPIQIIRKITQFRDARYTATLEFNDKTGRFSIAEVREFVRRADRTREIRLEIRRDTWTRRVFHDNKPTAEQTGKLKEGEDVLDPVAAFYNFLLGAYGWPQDEHDYSVPMFSRTGPATALVRILPRVEAREALNVRSPKQFGGRVTFDGTFMDLKVKEVLFVTDERFLPVKAVIREAGYLGQVEAFRIAPNP